MERAVLEELEFFRDLDEQAKQALLPNLKLVRFPAGAAVFREGDPPGDMFILRRGRVSVKTVVEGRTILHAELGAGALFGEMSVFENRPRSATIEAAEELEAIAIPCDVMRRLDRLAPPAAAAIYRALFLEVLRRLRGGNEKVLDHMRSRLRLLEREAQEKEFMHLLAHDLRSPLAIIDGGLRQLLDGRAKYGPLTPAQLSIAKRSRRSALFLRQLLDEILEVGRSEATQAREEATTLAEILLDAIPQSLARTDGPALDGLDEPSYQAMAAALETQGILLPKDTALLAAPLVVDKMRLIQIIMNLVGNALKYAPGVIAVRAKRAGERLEMAVIDCGAGIPEAFRASIFERYRQAGAKAEGVPRGFGLGLAGARQLVESLGGTIRAEAGDGGVGTAMIFSIPWKTRG